MLSGDFNGDGATDIAAIGDPVQPKELGSSRNTVETHCEHIKLKLDSSLQQQNLTYQVRGKDRKDRNSVIQRKQAAPLFLVAILFARLGLLPNAQAVGPALNAGYPDGNTAEWNQGPLSLSSNSYDRAVGLLPLSALTDSKSNTAVDAGTLLVSTANSKTATGYSR
jgi:hypothetical protein